MRVVGAISRRKVLVGLFTCQLYGGGGGGVSGRPDIGGGGCSRQGSSQSYKFLQKLTKFYVHMNGFGS